MKYRLNKPLGLEITYYRKFHLTSRLSSEQKLNTKKELQASSDAIKLKHGLEKALNHITKDPENAMPSGEMLVN